MINTNLICSLTLVRLHSNNTSEGCDILITIGHRLHAVILILNFQDLAFKFRVNGFRFPFWFLSIAVLEGKNLKPYAGI